MCCSVAHTTSLTCRNLADVRVTRTEVKRIAESLPFEPRQVADILLAVCEACMNGVRYGGASDIVPPVTIHAHHFEDHLRIEVADTGAGFQPSEPSMPDPMAESGRGIALMYALMDDVAIDSTKDGTRVRMIKYFTRDTVL
ncbi:MAG TPA: ATP-binding protein [Armatimonadota bacterium]|nr:ATP-binding protein [Armatimonadota bacterium]